MTSALLQIQDLAVEYRSGRDTVRAVRGVDLTIEPGEIVALVGESGSGKTTTGHAITRLLPAAARVTAGSIAFGGHELTTMSERQLAAVRGREIGLVPQDPGVAMNPVKRVGEQIAEVLRVHGLAPRSAAAVRAVELLERVGIDDPARRARQYPHQLSGGMRQRALIAMAVAAEPKLIIADEATSALDVTVQRLVLDQLATLTAEHGTAVLMITHDLAVAADRADRILVMSDGVVVEAGPAAAVLSSPDHDYTRRLLASAPALADHGPRRAPATADSLVEVRSLTKRYHVPGPPWRRSSVAVVDDVSFTIRRGETFGLVGESGSGKSTTARLVLNALKPTSGTVLFDGEDVTKRGAAAVRAFRRRAQLVYQNPYASLDPRLSIEDIVAEPLSVAGVGDRRTRRATAAALLERVSLDPQMLRRKPAELSGGQRQRVAIARAIALGPDLLVCDEPVSALDVSVQSQILDLLRDLQESEGLTCLFISHDLAVVRQVAHTVGVMQAGRLVEVAPAAQLFSAPGHPYTRQLLDAIPGRATPAVPPTTKGHP